MLQHAFRGVLNFTAHHKSLRVPCFPILAKGQHQTSCHSGNKNKSTTGQLQISLSVHNISFNNFMLLLSHLYINYLTYYPLFVGPGTRKQMKASSQWSASSFLFLQSSCTIWNLKSKSVACEHLQARSVNSTGCFRVLIQKKDSNSTRTRFKVIWAVYTGVLGAESMLLYVLNV